MQTTMIFVLLGNSVVESYAFTFANHPFRIEYC